MKRKREADSASSTKERDPWWTWQSGEALEANVKYETTVDRHVFQTHASALETGGKKKTERVVLERAHLPTATEKEPEEWPFKPQLEERFSKQMKQKKLSPFQRYLSRHLRTYRDVTCYNRQLIADGPQVVPLYALHAVDHVLRMKELILKNNDIIRAKQLAGQEPP